MTDPVPAEPESPPAEVTEAAAVVEDGLSIAAHAAEVLPVETSQEERLRLLCEPARDAEIAYKPIETGGAKWDPQARVFKFGNGGTVPGVDCSLCGQFLPQRHKHLTYMGHAAVTGRLLRVDPLWSWEPAYRDVEAGVVLAAMEAGNPEILATVLALAPPRYTDGGLWIRLTVCGITRLGFGDASGKTGPMATKEIIGDAIRNAAMRFGVGLDLWNKGEGSLFDVQSAGVASDVPPPAAAIPAREEAAEGRAMGVEVILSTLMGVRGKAAWMALEATARTEGLLDRPVTWRGQQVTLGQAFDEHARRLAAAGAAAAPDPASFESSAPSVEDPPAGLSGERAEAAGASEMSSAGA
jgi:hypothetical protein